MEGSYHASKRFKVLALTSISILERHRGEQPSLQGLPTLWYGIYCKVELYDSAWEKDISRVKKEYTYQLAFVQCCMEKIAFITAFYMELFFQLNVSRSFPEQLTPKAFVFQGLQNPSGGQTDEVRRKMVPSGELYTSVRFLIHKIFIKRVGWDNSLQMIYTPVPSERSVLPKHAFFLQDSTIPQITREIYSLQRALFPNFWIGTYRHAN